MATRRELTKVYAREYQRASKKAKGVMLDELCAATGWSRVNARRAIRQALAGKGRAGQQPRKPRPRKYSYDALKVLEQVWTLSGEPCGKYLALWTQVMARKNHLLPCVKAIGWTETSSGRTKRVYDQGNAGPRDLSGLAGFMSVT